VAEAVGQGPRPKEALDEWLTRIDAALAEAKAADPERIVAPYAVRTIWLTA
jgi:nitronate monooxygenase